MEKKEEIIIKENTENWDHDDLIEKIGDTYRAENLEEYWLQEQSSIIVALKKIEKALQKGRYLPKEILGVGGSGIVLRLSDYNFPEIDNALKFPRPVAGKVKLVSEMLEKEINFLSRLRHPGIVRILYYDSISGVEGYDKLPFYLMEVVEGESSKDYFNRPEIREEEFLNIVKHTAEIIQYLHTRPELGIAHLDIKPGNIVISKNERPIIIDLGTCKTIQKDEDITVIACTLSTSHPMLVRKLTKDPTDENRAKGELSRSEIELCWDIWSFGITLITWLGFDYETGEIIRNDILEALGSYSRKYLILLAARILVQDRDKVPSWLLREVGLSYDFLKYYKVKDAEELYDIIKRLEGSSSPLAKIEELREATSGTIQAAPNSHVPITNALDEVLKHPLFRRLNSITQLGFLSQVYPSAKHTRREHSLGTYANVCKILKSLYNDPISPLFKQIISVRDCRSLLLLALLHDIGQFPLAHELEDIDNKVFNHSELTKAILKGVWEKKTRGSSKVKFESFKEIYNKWGTSAERLIDIFDAKPSFFNDDPKNRLLRSILSGPIDADKLDYLFRDARQLDLPYPNGIDIDRLFRCLTTIVVPKVEGGVTDYPAIGVHSKGRVTAEFISLARYAMFCQGYWHHAVRAQRAMLTRAILALFSEMDEVELRRFQSEFVKMAFSLPEALYERSIPDQKEFQLDIKNGEIDKRISLDVGVEATTNLSATDAVVLSWLQQQLVKANRPESTLINRILNRSWFKRLWVISRNMDDRRWSKIVELWRNLNRQTKHRVSYDFENAIGRKLSDGKIVDITSMASQEASDLIGTMLHAKKPWLLIDIPSERPGSEVGLHYVVETQRRRLRKDYKAVGDLQESSLWIEYSRNLHKVAGKIRIFCHPKLIDTIDFSVKWEVGVDELIAVLERIVM